jgi:predicted amidohydrolase YtcJ
LLHLATGIFLLFSRQAPSLPPDTIFFGGKVVTVDPAFSINQAFAVRGEEFRAVGTDTQILLLAGPQTRKVDLHGSTVIPGLIDDHDHVYAAAMATRKSTASPITEREEDELILNMQKTKNAEGLTSVRDLNVGQDAVRAYQRLWRAGKLTLRTGIGLRLEGLAQIEQAVKTSGFATTPWDHWLRLDSASEAPTPIPGSPFLESVLLLNRHGWRPSPHLCDRGCGRPGEYESIDLALDAYEAADQESSIRNKRWALEHVPTVQPSQMERMARLGVVVSAQFQPFKWRTAEYDRMARTMGKPEIAERQVPMRDLLDHHVIVGTGSDSHNLGQTDNPFVPIYFYVTRKTEDGRQLDPRQKITREEALRVSTINNAYLTFEETVKGSIEAGKLADFVILSEDILTVPEDKILSIRPVATYVGGREVFSR